MMKRVAGIDIGTNTVLMLIADYQNKKIRRIAENYGVARLGEDLDKNGFIKREAIDRTKEILLKNYQLCLDYKVEKIIAVGTSALRDATNSKDVLEELNSVIKTDIQVISGNQEAALSFVGTVNNTVNSLVIDIGGGSTELIIGTGSTILEKVSLQMGAVRMTERYFNRNHPPSIDSIRTSEDTLNRMLSETKFTNLYSKTYAVAGTATTLATTALGLKDSQVDKVNGHILNFEDLCRIYDLYNTSSLDEIISKYGVQPGRADLILAGALIMKTIAQFYSIKEIIVSSHGLRYGILLNFFKKMHIL